MYTKILISTNLLSPPRACFFFHFSKQFRWFTGRLCREFRKNNVKYKQNGFSCTLPWDFSLPLCNNRYVTSDINCLLSICALLSWWSGSFIKWYLRYLNSTVKFRKLEVLTIFYNPKNDFYPCFPIKHLLWVRNRKVSGRGEIPITHPKHMFLWTVIKIVHK